jgi:hypothetical protein
LPGSNFAAQNLQSLRILQGQNDFRLNKENKEGRREES